MLCYKYSIRCWQPSLMLNHKVQTEERKRKEIWQSNSQIIFMLPLNKLTNAATLQKKAGNSARREQGRGRTRQTDSRTGRQTAVAGHVVVVWFLNRLSCQPSCVQHLSTLTGRECQEEWQGCVCVSVCVTVPLWQQTYSRHFTVA